MKKILYRGESKEELLKILKNAGSIYEKFPEKPIKPPCGKILVGKDYTGGLFSGREAFYGWSVVYTSEPGAENKKLGGSSESISRRIKINI